MVSYFLLVTPPCLIWSTLKKKLLCSLPIFPMDCIMTVWSSLSHNTDKDYLRAGKERMGGGQKRGNGAGKQNAVFVSWSSNSILLCDTIIGDSFFFKETNKIHIIQLLVLFNHSFSLCSVCGLRGAVLMCEGINCATRWFQPQMQGSFRCSKTV